MGTVIILTIITGIGIILTRTQYRWNLSSHGTEFEGMGSKIIASKSP
jgi:hypothetical protein